MIWRLALLLCLCGAAAHAQEDRSGRIEAAWRGWLEDHRVGKSALALTQNGGSVISATRGMSANDPAPLASLSKALTASCVERLVSDRALSFDDPVGRFLPSAPAGLTVSALLTHSGGLWPDTTQDTMWDWVNDAVNRHRDVTDTVFARPNQPAGQHRYNNENYAVLGSLIEAITGESYEDACRDRVIDPLALTSARRSPRYGPFLAWGGWEMSAADYARFLDRTHAAPNQNAPSAPLGQGVTYGLGVLQFAAEGTIITWHTGLLCFGSIDGAGAYAVKVDTRATAVVTFEGCPGEAALADLDIALLTAILR